MRHIVRKAYWDYEKEEKWLNEMSAKGLALKDYTWCRYVFADAAPNEYVYRIEFLKNHASHPESIAYIRFLEDNGVECVASYMRWVFMRKKTADGPFDIYSDLDSKIKHTSRVFTFWNTLMWVELVAGISNLVIGIVNLIYNYGSGRIHYGNLLLGGLLVLIGLFYFKISAPLRKKIRALRRERAVRE